ncbi:MAG: hypothetical protein ACM3KL_07140, partial [Alphaproteobacteria bacterium]
MARPKFGNFAGQYGIDLDPTLAVTPVRFVFLAVVLPPQLALLNFGTPHRHDSRRYRSETLEWR